MSAARRAQGVLASWFDASCGLRDGVATAAAPVPIDRIDWLRIVPFVGMHAAGVAIFWVGVSPAALWAMLLMYLLRMFAITGFYHRYFSHRSFKTSRLAQFIFGVLGASAVQRGPLWWAAHHRRHHAFSDQAQDVHSPSQRGFLVSHMGWFLNRRNFTADRARIRDWLRYPELRWLDRFDVVVPLLAAVALFGVGLALEQMAPQLGTSGWQMLVWGFFVSTVACFHATYTINSLCHQWGSRRYNTGDHSRNNALLALLTLGEGWHNNHHHYPLSARQGFFWWEIDITYYGLRLLALLGVIWELKPVPALIRNSVRNSVLDAARTPRGTHPQRRTP